MRHFWAKKDAQLESIVSIVREFFTSRDFVEGPGSKMEKGRNAMLFETCSEGKFRSIKVEVFERPGGFEIEFGPRQTAVSLAKMGTLATLFGGGILVKRRLESYDPSFYERLEGDFIDFLEGKGGEDAGTTGASSVSG